MPLKTKINLIHKSSLEVGLSLVTNEYLYFNNGSINKPGFRINTATSKIEYSNDGITWLNFTLTTTGGDLSGPHTNAKVIGINSIPLDTTQVPSNGQIYYYNLSQNKWICATIGGDVYGNINNTSVQGFNGIPLNSTTPLNGYAYLYNLAQDKFVPTLVALEPPAYTITTGGDCSGAITNVKVIKFNNYPLNTSQVPTNGQVFYYDSGTSKWVCGQIGGDVTGAYNDTRVVGIKGIPINLTAPTDGDTLIYNLSENKWNHESIGSYASTNAVDLFNVGGRLTLESGTPYMTSSAGYLNKTTLYWTPVKGGRLALYNGTYWDMFSPGEISITSAGLAGAAYPVGYDPDVSGHPNLTDPNVNYIGGKVYDVFMYLNTGVPALIFGPAWTDDNTRSEALTTQDNVLVQPTTKYRYIGTIRNFGYANEPTIFEQTPYKFSIWNYYNRDKISIHTKKAYSISNTWTIAVAGLWKVFGNISTTIPAGHVDLTDYGYYDPCNTITILNGLVEEPVNITCFGMGESATSNSDLSVNISINDTTTFNSSALLCGGTSGVGFSGYNMCQNFANYNNYPPLGFSIVRAINRNFYGNDINMYSDSITDSGACSKRVGLIADLYG